jgi:hypothetical protein
MSKIEKKRAKILARIEELEQEMYQNLKQKTSNTPEISIQAYRVRIEVLRNMLVNLK